MKPVLSTHTPGKEYGRFEGSTHGNEECVREACAGTKSVQVDYLLEVHGSEEKVINPGFPGVYIMSFVFHHGRPPTKPPFAWCLHAAHHVLPRA